MNHSELLTVAVAVREAKPLGCCHESTWLCQYVRREGGSLLRFDEGRRRGSETFYAPAAKHVEIADILFMPRAGVGEG